MMKMTALLTLLLAGCSASTASGASSTPSGSSQARRTGDQRSRSARCMNSSTVITPIHPGEEPRPDGGVETVGPNGERETSDIGECDPDPRKQ